MALITLYSTLMLTVLYVSSITSLGPASTKSVLQGFYTNKEIDPWPSTEIGLVSSRSWKSQILDTGICAVKLQMLESIYNYLTTVTRQILKFLGMDSLAVLCC